MPRRLASYSSGRIPVFWLVVVVLVAVVPAARAQQEPLTALNAVYAEALGNGVYYSVNYDRMLNDRLSVRVGVMAAGSVGAPIMMNYLLGFGSHHLEVGLGVVFLTSADVASSGLHLHQDDLSTTMATCTFGYRYQSPGGGYVFRAGFTPLFSFSFDRNGLPWAGASFGYSF